MQDQPVFFAHLLLPKIENIRIEENNLVGYQSVTIHQLNIIEKMQLKIYLSQQYLRQVGINIQTGGRVDGQTF